MSPVLRCTLQLALWVCLIQVRKVMRLLELTKNTFAGPLARLIKEVANSKHEAAEISRHLAPLRPFVEELQAATTPVRPNATARGRTAR